MPLLNAGNCLRYDLTRRDPLPAPAVAHARLLLDQCNDWQTACALAAVQIQCGREPKHWIEVYSVLVGEHRYV